MTYSRRRRIRKESGRGGFKQRANEAIKEKYREDAWVYTPSDRFRTGIHDFIICFFGYFVSIELKMPNSDEKQGDPMQRYNMRLILRANGFSFAATTMDEVMSGLENIYNVIKKT